MKSIIKIKRAQGLPMNVIILGVISLIVLVVLIYIIVNQTGIIKHSLQDCEAKDGDCVREGECSAIITDYECPYEETPVCCMGRCVSRGGTCKTDCDMENEEKVHYTECEGSGKKCCVDLNE